MTRNLQVRSLRNLLLVCLVYTASTLSGWAQERPNFIFILTDDQQYGLMGCTGNTIVQTPNLDQLAKEGVLFTNAHITSAICTPSRASILTSQFERKHGINFNSGTSMSEEGWANTYPMVMRENGYYTGWIGKNHVPVGKGGYASGLMEKSFDYWYAGHGHLGFYPKDRHEIFKDAKYDTQVEVIDEGVQDFLSNEQKLGGALKFIDQRPSDKPFMLSVCFNLPHGAGTGSMQMRDSDDEIYKSLYRDQNIPLPENYVARKDITTPKLPAELLHAEDRQTGYDYVDTPEGFKERYIRQMEALTGIDRLLGQLRKTLKDQKLDKNTVIVFTSDHGLFMGQFGLGGKALCYEETTHVPMIIFDPLTKKSKRGKTSDALVQSIDIAPTMMSMAGIPIPDSYQGKDLTPLLAGNQESVRPYLYTENLWSTQFGNPRCESVQDQEWKYIRYYKNENFSALKKIATAKAMGINMSSMLYKVHDPDIAVYRDYAEGPLQGEPAVYEELFNLKKDPKETTNLANDASLSDKLNTMRKVWKKEITKARGTGFPKVVRYTADSEAERNVLIEPK
ncbi:sulfatase family protein [Zobellia galactanivorans]|uniref:Sulfatase, family S1-25 n=1 Tax=Zobellia galactanivorans (strain DSM 12802 / CCUG 47099 / CIP 106680 / NCIMB 13871 / Dsij) TaxID=63186 RepID=G0L1N5_ZOBGA|nr:sulfatase [Zobellia galactanivorans]CAZ97780.1 Sulfatase, family S1-25 [Zobellia galactanivorans]